MEHVRPNNWTLPARVLWLSAFSVSSVLNLSSIRNLSPTAPCAKIGETVHHEHITRQACHADQARRLRQASRRRRHHFHLARQSGELGSQEFHLAAYLRPGLLRLRDDVLVCAAFCVCG